VQPFDKREAVSMNAFALKYGNQSITLAQSKQLIGVKLRQNKTDAQAAVQRTLPESSWKSEGLLGGFRLVSICDCAVDADQALDQIRRDESVLVGTHVFELSEGRGIFVPTGELFVGFKLGTSAELKEKVILSGRHAAITQSGQGGVESSTEAVCFDRAAGSGKQGSDQSAPACE
jgi:hypothetical protein